MRLSC